MAADTKPQGPATDWRRTVIQLTPELHDWARHYAITNRTTMAALMREALADLRNRLDPQQELPLR